MDNLHKLITETVPVFFFVYNLKSRLIEFVSPQFYDVVKDKESLEMLDPHEKLEKVINPEYRENFQKFFKELSEENSYEASVELKAGKQLDGVEWVEVNSFHPKRGDGTDNLVVGHIVNITEKKRQYAVLQEEHSNIEDVLNMIAHDMRTPFTHVEMVAKQLMKRMTAEELEKYNKYLDILLSTSQQSTRLLDALLDLATLKGETSKLDLDLQDMRFFIKGIVEKLEENISKKSLKLDLQFPDYTIEAKIDEVLFKQVVSNLLSNAIKFTPEGGTITISVRYTGEKNVELKIRDTGIGIPEKHLKNLFHGLSRLKRKGLQGEKSTGLGLYICKQIVKIHEGEIYVDSRQNEGSTFTIVLPPHSGSAAYF